MRLQEVSQVVELLFDDIGSFPLPEGVDREWMKAAFAGGSDKQKLTGIITDAFQKKVDAGVQVPTYPQYQDMNKQFLDIINGSAQEPFLVKKDSAKIAELDFLKVWAQDYKEFEGEKPAIRVCVTGPLELYLQLFGGTVYTDILDTLAKSVDCFIKNAISVSHFDVKTVSIDEPSIGINPNVMFEDNDLIKALTIATSSTKGKDMDTEIHLHSPLHYKLICEVPTIGVIGIESAANPSYIDLVDAQDLVDSDTYLRTGIARTDIFGLTASLNEKYDTNVWKDTTHLHEVVTALETPKVIADRLLHVYNRFGDRIKYVGPDCGLGAWPNQEIACILLKNTAKGIEEALGRMRG